MDRNDLSSTKPIDIWILGNKDPLDFDTYRTMCLNTSDIEFFNINPNDNLCLNMEYYKSLHCYRWSMKCTYVGNDDEPEETVLIRSVSGKTVFVF